MWVGGTAATTAKYDGSNGVGNQNSVVDNKDEVIDNGCPHEVGFNFTQSYPGII